MKEDQVPSLEYINKARQIVTDYYNKTMPGTGLPKIEIGSVYVVWFCKTLQNWKALLSTDVPDDTYYEVTYDGDQGRAYLDVYVKAHNEIIQDD